MRIGPESWLWFSKFDVLAAFLSNKGCCMHLLDVPRPTNVISVDDALVQLDHACSDGLRTLLDPESLVQLDATVAALMAGNDSRLPFADAVLNAREFGGPLDAWTQILKMARRKRLMLQSEDLIWSWHVEIAHAALARGMDAAQITEMQGWRPDHIDRLKWAAGLRRPGESAAENGANRMSSSNDNSQVGWGIDARCRGEPISVAVIEYQRMGWRWADSGFYDAKRPNPREGMAVTTRLRKLIRAEHPDPRQHY